MARPPARRDCRPPDQPPNSTANRTGRDKAPDKDKKEKAPAAPSARSCRRIDASCHKSSNTCPQTREFRRCTPAEKLAPASQLEDSRSHPSPGFPPVARAAAPRSAERTPPTIKHKSREAEKSEPATAMRDRPTARRWNEFSAPPRITKRPCHSERGRRPGEESAVLAAASEL